MKKFIILASLVFAMAAGIVTMTSLASVQQAVACATADC
jgi:hypothetical protein